MRRVLGAWAWEMRSAWLENLLHEREVILLSSLILSRTENHFRMELNFPVAFRMILGQLFVECFVSFSHCSRSSMNRGLVKLGACELQCIQAKYHRWCSAYFNFFQKPTQCNVTLEFGLGLLFFPFHVHDKGLRSLEAKSTRYHNLKAVPSKSSTVQ